MGDPAAPDLGFLARDAAVALRSFFATVERICADNPVAAESEAAVEIGCR